MPDSNFIHTKPRSNIKSRGGVWYKIEMIYFPSNWILVKEEEEEEKNNECFTEFKNLFCAESYMKEWKLLFRENKSLLIIWSTFSFLFSFHAQTDPTMPWSFPF